MGDAVGDLLNHGLCFFFILPFYNKKHHFMIKRQYKEKAQTMVEEIANSITHGLGLGLSIVGLTLLIVYSTQSGDPWRVVSFSIYGASLTILYLAFKHKDFQ
jgi:predicted membrane channel-forming protein YqfA (hemolysin III family)